MRVLWFSCVVAIAAACSSDEAVGKGVAEGCVINSDCSSPLVCAFRKCHVACLSSRDCQPGQRCMASDRPFHVCQLADERICTFNSDCPPDQVCGVDGQCRDQCSASRDCLFEQTCVGGTCADDKELVNGAIVVPGMGDAGTTASGVPCLYTSECPDTLVCRNKICSSECLTLADCSPGNACVNNRCVTGSGALIGTEGGVVTVAGGKVKLTIPPNSLRSTVSILILPLEAWPAGALGQVYQIVPSGLQFDPAATLTFTYDAADIGATPPDQLKVASAVGSKWSALASSVDVATKTVSAPLAHLSTYGIVGPAVSIDAGAGGTGGSLGAGGAPGVDSGSAAGGSLGLGGSGLGDAGLPRCQVICMSIDGCNCHTVTSCGGHDYSCSGPAGCTCSKDSVSGATVDATCVPSVLTDPIAGGCGYPFIAVLP